MQKIPSPIREFYIYTLCLYCRAENLFSKWNLNLPCVYLHDNVNLEGKTCKSSSTLFRSNSFMGRAIYVVAYSPWFTLVVEKTGDIWKMYVWETGSFRFFICEPQILQAMLLSFQNANNFKMSLQHVNNRISIESLSNCDGEGAYLLVQKNTEIIHFFWPIHVVTFFYCKIKFGHVML